MVIKVPELKVELSKESLKKGAMAAKDKTVAASKNIYNRLRSATEAFIKAPPAASSK